MSTGPVPYRSGLGRMRGGAPLFAGIVSPPAQVISGLFEGGVRSWSHGLSAVLLAFCLTGPSVQRLA